MLLLSLSNTVMRPPDFKSVISITNTLLMSIFHRITRCCCVGSLTAACLKPWHTFLCSLGFCWGGSGSLTYECAKIKCALQQMHSLVCLARRAYFKKKKKNLGKNMQVEVSLGNKISLRSFPNVSAEFKMWVLVPKFLPFILDADPGWNKTAITVPNSFIRSISTCSPECSGRVLSKANVN